MDSEKKRTINSSAELWPEADLVDPHTQEDKGRRVREMFDTIARRYDVANMVISFGMAGHWRRTLATMLRKVVPCAGAVLDLACGTGDMMIELGRIFPQAKVTGIDFSGNMLLGAKKKFASNPFIGSQRSNGSKLRCNSPSDAAGDRNSIVGQENSSMSRYCLCQGDAMALPVGSETFDAVTCVFGLRNFQSLAKGLDEIVRVLKPGGCLAVLEFQPPGNKLFAFFFNIYFEKILPFLGKKIARAGSSRAYEYLPRSVKCWHDGNFVLKLLKEYGLNVTEVRKMCLGSVWAIVAVK